MSDEKLLATFVTSVLTPLRDASSVRRADALAMVRVIKGLLADFENSIQGAGTRTRPELVPPASLGGRNGANLDASSARDKWLLLVKEWTSRERSIAREMEILRVLEEAEGAVMLKSLHTRMVLLGLSEKGSQAAVVTQISRLKNKHAVAWQGQGLYSRADGGSDRLQKMQLNYRVLMVPEEVRKGLQ